MTIREEQDAEMQREWEDFAERYPILTSDNIFTRIRALFYNNTARLLWENGYLQGWLNKARKDDRMEFEP